MKYIKTFEQLNMGDYVVFPKYYSNIRKNYPYQITSIGPVRIYFNDDNDKERNMLLDFDGYKKISKEEAKQLLINNKYNL